MYLRNSNTQGIADIKFFFGNPGDVPIAGDFNGDGFDTVSIYRPSNQTFYIINKLGSGDQGLGAADFSYVFGNPGDKPFVGDFNGNGVETAGLHASRRGWCTSVTPIRRAMRMHSSSSAIRVTGSSPATGPERGVHTGVVPAVEHDHVLRYTNTQERRRSDSSRSQRTRRLPYRER